MWHGSSPVPTEKTHGATERLNHPHPTFDLFVMVRLQPRFKRHRAVNPLKCLPNLPGRGGGGGGGGGGGVPQGRVGGGGGGGGGGLKRGLVHSRKVWVDV